ncbi:MAG TPA: GAF domain-containing protein [Candidatus Baltobacterales bacterium]|nr:GAF domain-containing protein [Candidatus Baltobacterales bacterium]
MNSDRATFALRIGFSAAAAALILVGAPLNAGGRVGWAAVLATAAGVLAFAAGVTYSRWRLAIPPAAVALVVSLVIAQFNAVPSDLLMQLGGLLLLGLAGVVGGIAYRSFTATLKRHLIEADVLRSQLEQKHRRFMAATSDADGPGVPGDVGALTINISHEVGADLACYYLVSPDGHHFIPQPPGIGLEHLHPQPVPRRPADTGPIIEAVEAGKSFAATDREALLEIVRYASDDLHIKGLLAVPMPIGEHIGGFILLGNRSRAFSEDDRRLATTLTLRAGALLASAHAVALSRRESARYSLMNELIKEASGKTMNEVLELVLDKGKEVIRYEGGRALLFQADGTYLMLDGTAEALAVEGQLLKVRQGETVLRALVEEKEHIYSGLQPDQQGGTVNEALTPIRGKSGVIGALCLGRRGTSGFSHRDVPALDELGSMAGVAVENSRILQVVTGQASKLDTTLDALGEVSQALTTMTQGSEVLKLKTLEAAVRVTMGTAGLLTRTTPEGRQKVTKSLGFPAEVDALDFQNGQGIVGAVMLSLRVTTVPDVSASFDLSSPPDLAGYGIKAAMSAPMLEDNRLWGTISVFDAKKREWTEDDQRVLTTLGNQAVVAVRNADVYSESERRNWELGHLQKALKAATETLDLAEVLQRVLEDAANAASAKIGALALEEDGKLILRAPFGTDHVTAERLALGVGGEICQSVMDSGEPFMEAMKDSTGADSPLNPRAVLCVPIKLEKKPIGVLFLANYQDGQAFNADHRHLLTELADQAGVVIENARLFKGREEVMLASLKALAIAVDARDPYTKGHSERVTQYALMIARQMHYAPDEPAAWGRLESGCLVHDIGKIGVPDAILTKTGKLTDEEFAKMKEHPVVGFNILSGLKMLTDELVIVRSHHERYDGKGYPDRKKSDELPLFSWIVSAADAIDAMTSDRPYRRGMPLEVAVDQVRAGAGTHFHPDVAEAVLDAVHNGTLKIITQKSMYENAPAIGAFENPTT